MLEDDVGLSLTPPGLEHDSSGRNPSPSNTPEQRKPTERTENTHTASACPQHVEGQMAGRRDSGFLLSGSGTVESGGETAEFLGSLFTERQIRSLSNSRGPSGEFFDVHDAWGGVAGAEFISDAGEIGEMVKEGIEKVSSRVKLAMEGMGGGARGKSFESAGSWGSALSEWEDAFSPRGTQSPTFPAACKRDEVSGKPGKATPEEVKLPQECEAGAFVAQQLPSPSAENDSVMLPALGWLLTLFCRFMFGGCNLDRVLLAQFQAAASQVCLYARTACVRACACTIACVRAHEYYARSFSCAPWRACICLHV